MIYEFRCEACNKIMSEKLPVSSRKKETVCLFCKGTANRIISKNTFILKGGGWAEDGYSRRNE